MFVYAQKPPPTLPKPKVNPYLTKSANTNSGVPSFISNQMISMASQERLRGGYTTVSQL